MSSTGNNAARRAQVQAALTAFADAPLPKASTSLLNSLGYASEKTADLGSSAETLLANIEQFKPELGKISRDKVKADRWKSCTFLFQLTNDEIPSLLLPSPAGGRGAGGEGLARSLIESFVFLSIELQGESWSRTDLAAIARELNRRFPMPAIVIFKHGLPSPAGGGGAGGEGISLEVIDRRANLKDAAKDVIDSRIIASLKTKLEAAGISLPSPASGRGVGGEGGVEARLRHLFAYNDQQHQFSAAEVAALIEAIDHLKILDPACGSGAFPMSATIH
jgi:hypothetical protein